MTKNKNKFCSLIGIIFIFLLIISITPIQPNSIIKINDNISSSALEINEVQWIDNNDFTSQGSWFFKKGSQGDNSSVYADISNNQANIKVLGETRTFNNLSGVPNSPTSQGWTRFNNDGFLLPDSSGISSEGCYASHTWSEGPNQFPSVHWRKNVSLSDNMLDYSITNVTLNVIFNASVNANVDAGNDASSVQYYAIGDFVRFYVQISDIDYKNSYTVAFNKTLNLGQNTGTSVLSITDKFIETYNQSFMITALNSAFEKDPDHSNFTITLGIDIYSEDNFQGTDTDTFTSLMIKSCNLSFAYEKKIEQFTSISLNQIGDQISPSFQVNNATLNFDYKIDQLWPTALSPFSELRILINDNLHSETVRLSSALTSFQEAKLGGFDITALILKGINISLSIQLFIADTFGLSNNISLSIDNVYFNITYTETVPDYETQISLFLNGENKTTDPFLEIALGRSLNVTLKFSDSLGIHLGGANIKLSGPGFIENLIENGALNHYSVVINSTEKLNLGINPLTVEAQLLNYQPKIINPSISVRRINAELDTLTGDNVLNIDSGGSASLAIIINNTDFGGFIKGAVVLYSGDLGDGVLTDPNNDGIYDSTIRNIAEGSYTITITAIGSDDYTFQSFQLTINAITPEAPDIFWLIILLTGGIIGIVSVFGLYQFYFKFPPLVRKIRKLKKKISKGKKTNPIIVSNREEISRKNFEGGMKVLESDINRIQPEKFKNMKDKSFKMEDEK
ncbi:MAG: hypothetical protein ACFFE4_12515 [Candidatus Thorarchaeota archaeon]